MSTPEHWHRSATFRPDLQAAIPPEIRAKMDAHRKRAQEDRANTPPGYRRLVPGEMTKDTDLFSFDPKAELRKGENWFQAGGGIRVTANLCATYIRKKS